MACQRRRLFVFWSVHKDPFPEATTPLSRVTRYLLACILSIVQLALMVGVPAIPSLLAYLTSTKLWSALADAGKIEEAREVLGYLILLTILLVFSIWGAIPMLAVARVHGKRARTAVYMLFGGMLVVFLGVSVRSIYLTMNWALRFDDDARLSGWCKVITQVLGALLYLCWISVVVSFFYVARFGTPMFIRQMMNDVTNFLYPDFPVEREKGSKSDDA